ncbi:hypothetical protein AGMMS50262_13070 [Bacteroidia bacterium]|nr:hypothetical protein AGMMS50262_13070 [Bacteroidia bacterium]
MKHIILRTFMGIAGTAMLFAACNNDDGDAGALRATPLQLATQMDAPQTRASANNTWDGGEQVMVSIDNAAATSFTVAADKTTLTPATPIYWTLATQSLTARAWYPAAWTMQADQSTAAKLQEADFLFAPTTGTLSGSGSGEIAPLKSGSADTYTALLIPRDMTAANFIRVAIGSEDYYYKPASGEANLAAGSSYTYNILVKKTGLDVTVVNNGAQWAAGSNDTVTAVPLVLKLILASTGAGAFVSGNSTTATITAAAERNGNSVAIGANPVTWTVINSSITAAWWGDSGGRSRTSGAMNGLAWGTTPISLHGYEDTRTNMSGVVGSGGGGGTGSAYASPDTGATATLTDIVGSRQVELRAEVTINGETYAGATTINFGNGPLSEFKRAPNGSKNWANAGSNCGDAGNPNNTGYQPSTKLPRQEQLQAVAGSGNGGRQGAAHAAGWRDDTNDSGWFLYWIGEANGTGNARVVNLGDGGTGWISVSNDIPVAVCVP